MKIIGIIRQAGGSKRVQREKNIKLLGNKPLLAILQLSVRSLEFIEPSNLTTDDQV